MKRKVVAVIPARMAASRFPGKPLAKILDLPMIEHVRRRALLCPVLDEVYVATCDQPIFDLVTACGGKAVMTKDTHVRCTDRVEEAVEKIKADIVVILQGDEPLFEKEVIEQLVAPFNSTQECVCTNLVTSITDNADIADNDIVKALLDVRGHVLYFSRAQVPFIRVKAPFNVYRQTGLSAFTIEFLKKFASLPPTPLEITESVDFLRILEHRYPIKGIVHSGRSIGVDRPEDVPVVEDVLRKDSRQQRIYQEICLMS